MIAAFILIRQYIFHIAIVGAMVTGIVWVVYDIYYGHQSILEEKQALVLQKSQHLSQWLGSTVLAVDYVLHDVLGRVGPEVLPAETLGDPDWQARTSALLREKQNTVAGLAGLMVYDARCRVVAASDPGVIGTDSRQDFCRDPGLKVGPDLYVHYQPAGQPSSQPPLLLISLNRATTDGRLQAGVLAAIDLGAMQARLETVPIGENDMLALVDGRGTLLARKPPLAGHIGTALPIPGEYPPLGEHRTSTTFTARAPLDGRERLFGVSRIDRAPLAVVVGLDTADMLAEWRQRALRLGFGHLARTVIAIFVLRILLVTRRQREDLRKLATTDSLTGVANRRHLIDVGQKEQARIRRYAGALSVLILDIDHFKKINDTWGHPTGDRAIRALAETTRLAVRDQDMVGRLGGEEFAVILTETDLDAACVIAERLRLYLAETWFACENGLQARFTVSIGVSSLTPQDQTFDDLLGRADRALYQAKDAGRNCVVWA